MRKQKAPNPNAQFKRVRRYCGTICVHCHDRNELWDSAPGCGGDSDSRKAAIYFRLWPDDLISLRLDSKYGPVDPSAPGPDLTLCNACCQFLKKHKNLDKIGRTPRKSRKSYVRNQVAAFLSIAGDAGVGKTDEQLGNEQENSPIMRELRRARRARPRPGGARNGRPHKGSYVESGSGSDRGGVSSGGNSPFNVAGSGSAPPSPLKQTFTGPAVAVLGEGAGHRFHRNPGHDFRGGPQGYMAPSSASSGQFYGPGNVGLHNSPSGVRASRPYGLQVSGVSGFSQQNLLQQKQLAYPPPAAHSYYVGPGTSYPNPYQGSGGGSSDGRWGMDGQGARVRGAVAAGRKVRSDSLTKSRSTPHLVSGFGMPPSTGYYQQRDHSSSTVGVVSPTQLHIKNGHEAGVERSPLHRHHYPNAPPSDFMLGSTAGVPTGFTEGILDSEDEDVTMEGGVQRHFHSRNQPRLKGRDVTTASDVVLPGTGNAPRTPQRRFMTPLSTSTSSSYLPGAAGRGVPSAFGNKVRNHGGALTHSRSMGSLAQIPSDRGEFSRPLVSLGGASRREFGTTGPVPPSPLNTPCLASLSIGSPSLHPVHPESSHPLGLPASASSTSIRYSGEGGTYFTTPELLPSGLPQGSSCLFKEQGSISLPISASVSASPHGAFSAAAIPGFSNPVSEVSSRSSSFTEQMGLHPVGLGMVHRATPGEILLHSTVLLSIGEVPPPAAITGAEARRTSDILTSEIHGEETTLSGWH